MVAEEFPAVKLIRLEENIGAPAWNRAFAVARGDWVLILDDDCWVEGDAMKLAVAAARANAADLVSFRVRSSVDPSWYFTERQYYCGMLSFWGCAWLISARALGPLGGYEPYIFMWANELELAMRFYDQGFRHLYLPEVVAVHMKPPVKGEEPFQPELHKVNYRHWAFVASKLMHPSDAARVLLRLWLMTAIEMLKISPRAAVAVGATLSGFRAGLRVRRPVRREVSAIYRDNFISFVNPLIFVRPPWELLVAAIKGQPEPYGARRWMRFRSRRARFFPSSATLLEL